MPVLQQHLPLQATIVWSKDTKDGSPFGSMKDGDISGTTALATFMRTTLPDDGLSHQVELFKLNFSSNGCDEILDNGISQFQGRSLGISSCNVGSPTRIAHALTDPRSQVKKLCLSWLDLANEPTEEPDTEAEEEGLTQPPDNAATFWTVLVGGLANLPRLESLDCGMWRIPDIAMEQVVRGAARCSSLKMLRLESPRFTEPIYQAMVDCVRRADSKLHEIKIRCSDNIHGWDVSDDLFKAMRTNYTIECVSVRRLTKVGVRSVLPEEQQKLIDALCRLNRQGRKYLATDASNKDKGVALLVSVSDDLNCLFYHMRENPILCLTWPKASKPID